MSTAAAKCKSCQLDDTQPSADVCALAYQLCCLKQSSASPPSNMCLCKQAEFSAAVEQGFQACPAWHQGSIIANETGAAGPPLSTVSSCSWALTMRQKVGWGDAPATGATATVASADGSNMSGRDRVERIGTAAASNGRSGRSSGSTQKATAGWLSMLSLFEPHWQVSCTKAQTTSNMY